MSHTERTRIIRVAQQVDQQTQVNWVQITVFSGNDSGGVFEQKTMRLERETFLLLARHVATEELPFMKEIPWQPTN